MDVKLNINLNSNLMSVGKSSAATSAANLKNVNLQSGDKASKSEQKSIRKGYGGLA